MIASTARRRLDVADDGRTVVMTRAAIAALAVAAGFHYSLASLMRGLRLDTPLAYLGLVPALAVGLAISAARRSKRQPDVYDRQVDYIVGFPLLMAALAIAVYLPPHLSTLFWAWRMDLLAIPLFVAGAVTLLFGVRMLWRVRVAVAFLFLAWPLPYNAVLAPITATASTATVALLEAIVVHLPVAVATGDAGVFVIGDAVTAFQVSVASACAGVNGVLGFLLVGGAVVTAATGTRAQKAAWLMVGATLVWLLNVVRILLIFVAGAYFGEDVAIDGLHPFIGLIIFNLAIVVLLLGLPRFHLSLGSARPGPRTSIGSAEAIRAVPRGQTAAAIVIVFALLLGLTNAELRRNSLLADDLGATRLAAFRTTRVAPEGWITSQAGTYDWAARYFGRSARWDRFLYTADGETVAQRTIHPETPGTPVIADVVTTSELDRFSAYGIESCYRFHGYRFHRTSRVELGGGVTGHVVSFHNPKRNTDWTTVWWIWRVETPDGATRYERIALMLADVPGVRSSAPERGAALARSAGIEARRLTMDRTRDPDLEDRLDRAQRFLVEFADGVIAGQAAASAERSDP